MDFGTIMLIVVFGLIIAYAIGYLIVKKVKAVKALAVGKNGEKKVKKALDKLAKKQNFKTIHDLYLPLYDKTTQMDHVLIGNFGVLIIETKSLNGDIYGNEKDENWTQVIGEKKHKLYNPLMQNKAHVDCMQHIFRTKNIYSIQVDSLVVFASKNVILNISKGLPVITLSLLKKYLKKSRYTKDNNVDIDKLYNCLIDSQVTDKELLKKHNSNVKKMSKK